MIIDGCKIAHRIQDSLMKELDGKTLRLGLLCSNISPSSASYQEKIIRDARALGIEVDRVRCPDRTPQRSFEEQVLKWNEDSHIHGIFVLQPLPSDIDVELLRSLMHPLKDIECVHPYDSRFRYLSNDHVGSCTAMAVMEILRTIDVKLCGAEVVVVGHSNIVGKPVSEMLIKEGATVTTCDKGTSERGYLRKHIKRAEILVVAVGKPNFIPGDWVRGNAVVIDVGVNDDGKGKMVGDVCFETAKERARFITPVKGGVGPVTSIIGMRQLLIAYQLQQL